MILNCSSSIDVFIAKFDSNGNFSWAQQGYPEDSIYFGWVGSSISTDTLNQVYVSIYGFGSTMNRGLEIVNQSFTISEPSQDGPSVILKLDTTGKYKWGTILAGGGDDGNSIVSTSKGNAFYFGGDLYNTVAFGSTILPLTSNENPFIAKWGECSGTNLGLSNALHESNPITLYPNPNNGIFTLQSSGISGQSLIEVYNMLGEQIATLTQPSPSGEGASAIFQINLSNQPNGIYLYRIIDNTGALLGSGKFVIEK